MKPAAEAKWWREHFPNVSACNAADRAIDKLPIDAPMSVYLDTWVTAYLKAGGKTPLGRL